MLYLTAALVAHQVNRGSYDNTVRMTQSFAPTAEEEKAGKSLQDRDRYPAAGAGGRFERAGEGDAGKIDGGLLTFERLEKHPDPKHAGGQIPELPTIGKPTGSAPGVHGQTRRATRGR